MRRNLWVSELAVMVLLGAAGSATRRGGLAPVPAARLRALRSLGERLLGRAELELMVWKSEAPSVPPATAAAAGAGLVLAIGLAAGLLRRRRAPRRGPERRSADRIARLSRRTGMAQDGVRMLLGP